MCKLRSIMIVFLFTLNVFVSSASVFADTQTPADSSVTLTNLTAAKLTSAGGSVAISVAYTPVRTANEPVTSDVLKLTLPEGFIYQPAEPASTGEIVQAADNQVEIDLTKLTTDAVLQFTLDQDQLQPKSMISGRHYQNDKEIGKIKALVFDTSDLFSASFSASSTSSTTVDSTADSVASSAETKRVVPKSAAEAPAVAYKRLLPAAALDLGSATMRALPVESITAGKYSNAVYFDIDSKKSWDEALSTKNNNQSEITYLNITNDFSFSDKTSGGLASMSASTLHTAIKNKKLIINGNHHVIDFRGRTHWLDDVDWDVVVQNLTYYGSNDWGVFEGYNSGENPTVTFFNVTQVGGQAFEGSRGKVVLGGTSSFQSAGTESYVSPLDNQTVHLDTRYTFGAYKGSANFAASEIYVKADSDLSVNNGRLGSNFTIFSKGNFYVEDGTSTTINLTNTDTGSAGGKWYVNDYCPAAISIVDDIPATASPWDDTARPATLKNRYNSMYLGENTRMTIENGAARASYPGAVEIEQDNGSLELAKNAQLSVQIEKDSGKDGEGQTAIAFDKQAGSISLGESSKLTLSVGKTADIDAASGTGIRFSGDRSSIAIGKAATLSVSSTSNDAQGLLDFSGANTTFTISDQGVLDLGYLQNNSRPLIRMKDGRISIPANGDYLHAIKEWQSNNFDQDQPDLTIQPLNKTTIQVKDTQFSSSTSATAANTVALTNSFSNTMQRLVIEPLNYLVTIDPISNENKSDYVVTGTAAPATGTVLLSGSALDQLPESERTVPIQPDGSYKWHKKLVRPFNAGEKVTAVYVGKQAAAETVILDKTKPAAKAKAFHLIEGEKIPQAVSFIKSVTDTNPSNTNLSDFTYDFSDTAILPGAIAVISNGSDQQAFNGHLTVADKAHNVSATIEVKLIVHKASSLNTISASDFTTTLANVSGLTPGSAEYKQYILQKTGAVAYTIKAGALTQLPVEIANLPDIKNQIGTYKVQLKVQKDEQAGLTKDLTKTVNWTIKSNLVKPDDPSKDPDGGAENSGTGAVKELRFDYVPSTFSFGTIGTSATPSFTNAELTEQDKRQWVQLSDDRKKGVGWVVKAQISDFVSTTDPNERLQGASIVLPKGALYNQKTGNQKNPVGLVSGGNISLTDDEQTIFSGSGENSKQISTYVWAKQAVKLKIPGGQGKSNQQYRATVTWIVEDKVSN